MSWNRYFSLISQGAILNPDCAIESVSRHRKSKRNAQLERFCDVGILINTWRSNPPLRVKIVKQALQQGFSSRSKRLLHNPGQIFIIRDANETFHFVLPRTHTVYHAQLTLKTYYLMYAL
jgi:hypothetical protein